MPDDLLTVLLCELGERILALRELLAEPSIAAKSHTRAVAALLAHGLDAVEQRLHADVLVVYEADPAAALRAYDDCGCALRQLHRRLGLLDMRWSAAPVDIFLRKLREDAAAIAPGEPTRGVPTRGVLPHPAVVLADEYEAPDDAAARLRVDLAAHGVTALAAPDAEPVLALPRLEAANPLAWPLLLPALLRQDAARQDALRPDDERLTIEGIESYATRLCGPAVFAARAVHALLTAMAGMPAWPDLAGSAAAARAYAAGLEERERDHAGEGPARDGTIGLLTRVLRRRDYLLGFDEPVDAVEPPYVAGADHPPQISGPATHLSPSAGEAAALLAKLADGIPINAVEPPLPSDFVARLDAVSDASGLYALIDPLGERPAALAAILGVGWLYKVRYSYPLFARLLRELPLGEALASYRPHRAERDELLLQSIEAAHVQGIFVQGRIEP